MNKLYYLSEKLVYLRSNSSRNSVFLMFFLAFIVINGF